MKVAIFEGEPTNSLCIAMGEAALPEGALFSAYADYKSEHPDCRAWEGPMEFITYMMTLGYSLTMDPLA